MSALTAASRKAVSLAVNGVGVALAFLVVDGSPAAPVLDR